MEISTLNFKKCYFYIYKMQITYSTVIMVFVVVVDIETARISV